ncbi:MAG: peptidoglycan DD-metalloendopeptidase family protein [Oscillospiraceae bacterium]|nr:peptidoglycan DD-metalloendopeptidase family protein [Oscillospiraceae bacterium]
MLKNMKKTLIFVLIAAILIGAAVPLFGTGAYAVTQDEIDDLEEEKEKIAEKVKVQQDKIEALEKEKSDFLELKVALEERNAYTLRQMELNQLQIDYMAEIIEQKSLELASAVKAEQDQLEKYRTRVRAMEENGSYDLLAIFLNADSLGSLLSAMDDIGEIMDADKKLEDEYIAARQHSESVKAEYESLKAELDLKQEKLLEEQEALQAQIDETDQMLEELKSSIDEESETLEGFQKAVEEAQAEIDRLTEELERERRAAIAASAGATGYSGGTVSGSGNFIWPVSCTYITSCVGYRYHPISGQWKYHSGMDIGSQYGDSIWASDGGTVCIAGVNGGYGNCVMIDHGNGYYTLYGHMSSIAVSVNQTVSQGQVIGYVGSTGYSTGPHLHFEIRSANSNGTTTCLEFNNWFSGLTFSPDSGG